MNYGTYKGSRLGEQDLYLFNEGTHHKLYERLGAHVVSEAGAEGAIFAVWAPNAERVSVIGDFNDWRPGSAAMEPRGRSGIWESFVRGAGKGSRYKYHIESRYGGYSVNKADPYGFFHEEPPKTASVVWDLNYDWGDQQWLSERSERQRLSSPISIYEVHLGSWMQDQDGNPLSYRELASRLAAYVRSLNFTHVEFLPVMEHPFRGSWGYQVTGYFAPTSRFGKPQDFMYLIDHLHREGIGVILDWVPAHFPNDEHGLAYFDGTHLYEHADPRLGFHPDWNSCIFNYSRHEVRSFLLSSALFWLDHYHIDGLRVDGVASMLYRDYSRKQGEWLPNEHGGRENLEAISLLREFNTAVYERFPDVQTIAEESTAWPMVSRPVYTGGLGFGFKWDMGWMHDTLQYMQRDPIHRTHHHHELTFRGVYAFTENFVLPLSHDEVVHGKGSLIGKMPGDDWQKFANLRLLFAYMYAQPGKKLLFMGGELAQRSEWSHDHALDWSVADHEFHRGIRQLLTNLNRIYRDQPALHEADADSAGFEWIVGNDNDNSVVVFERRPLKAGKTIVAALNFTPIVRRNYRVGVEYEGCWEEILNSDAGEFGGSGQGNLGGVETTPTPSHGRVHSINLTLPPLGGVYLASP